MAKRSKKPRASQSRKSFTLADRMRAGIEARGWSNYYVAKHAGLTEAMLSRFMRGKTTPNLDSAERILNLLGWTICEQSDGKARR